MNIEIPTNREMSREALFSLLKSLGIQSVPNLDWFSQMMQAATVNFGSPEVVFMSPDTLEDFMSAFGKTTGRVQGIDPGAPEQSKKAQADSEDQ